MDNQPRETQRAESENKENLRQLRRCHQRPIISTGAQGRKAGKGLRGNRENSVLSEGGGKRSGIACVAKIPRAAPFPLLAAVEPLWRPSVPCKIINPNRKRGRPLPGNDSNSEGYYNSLPKHHGTDNTRRGYPGPTTPRALMHLSLAPEPVRTI